MARKGANYYDYDDDYDYETDDDRDYYGKSQEEESSLGNYKANTSLGKKQTYNNHNVQEHIEEESPAADHPGDEEMFAMDDEVPASSKSVKAETSFKIGGSPKLPENVPPEPVVVPQIQQLRISAQDASGSTSRPNSTSPARMTKNSSTAKLSAVETAINASTNHKQRQRPTGTKPAVNFVVVGHVDAGKSTLMGHLLYQLGCVNKKTVSKYKQEAQKMGKSSFYYAWILDETDEERTRGVTMDIARACFETESRKYNILDAPGHRDFIPNMITGASQSDAALLVICATRGEFESGFDLGGQTREHALLIRSLGVSHIVVAVNKMDTIEWSKDRFDEIDAILKTFLLRQAGFSKTTFIPVSGITGDNLVKPLPDSHPLKKWYKGPTLIEALEALPAPERPENMPLRIVVNDILKSTNTVLGLSAKVEAGHVEHGDKVFLMPRADPATVKGVCIDDHSGAAPPTTAGKSQVCFAGDQILITLQGNFENEAVTAGHVICRGGPDCLVPSRKFTARIVVFDSPIPIIRGTKAELFAHSLCVPCTVKQLKCILDKSTGEVIKEKPRCLPKNSSALIVIETDTPVNLEAYSQCKPLGRISIRANGVTIGAGIIDTAHPEVGAALRG